MAHKKVQNPKKRARFRRKYSIRKKIQGTPERPRLSVFRSLNHIYAQAIDDSTGAVLASASDVGGGRTPEMDGKKKGEVAKLVGEIIGKKLVERQVSQVVFDRNGFIYHGRVKAVAEGARGAGLQF
jgi:large subunit ribosomal protein L18